MVSRSSQVPTHQAPRANSFSFSFSVPTPLQVKTGASESDIWQTIDMLKERYSDYGSDRRSAIEFHTNQLEKVRVVEDEGRREGGGNISFIFGLLIIFRWAS